MHKAGLDEVPDLPDAPCGVCEDNVERCVYAGVEREERHDCFGWRSAKPIPMSQAPREWTTTAVEGTQLHGPKLKTLTPLGCRLPTRLSYMVLCHFNVRLL